MTAVITLIVCCVFGGGAFYFAKHLENEQGVSAITSGLKGVGALIITIGLARGAFILVRDGALRWPSGGGGAPVSRQARMTQCQVSTGMSTQEVSSSFCECAANAAEAGQAVDPDMSVPTDLSRYEGTAAAEAAFRSEFGRCANTRVRTWLAAECQHGCNEQGEASTQQEMACSRICRCVVSWGMQGQTPETITDLFWSGGESNDTVAVRVNNIVVRGLSHCQNQ